MILLYIDYFLWHIVVCTRFVMRTKFVLSTYMAAWNSFDKLLPVLFPQPAFIWECVLSNIACSCTWACRHCFVHIWKFYLNSLTGKCSLSCSKYLPSESKFCKCQSKLHVHTQNNINIWLAVGLKIISLFHGWFKMY